MLIFCNARLQAQQEICYGSTLRYSVDATENSGKGSLGSTYLWSVQETSFRGTISSYLPDRTNDVFVHWDSTPPGIYHLLVKEKNTTGCIGVSQTLEILVHALPYTDLTKEYVCINPLTKELVSTAILDTKLSSSAYSFDWQFNGNTIGNTASIEVVDIGSYSVEIQDLKTKCKSVNPVSVVLSSTSVSKITVANFFEDNQSIVIAVLDGKGDYEYSIDGLNFQESPVFQIAKGGVYTVVIRDKNGCGDETIAAHVVTYPKFFTPNNDGYFDTWNIDGLTPEMKPVVSIFNRFSKLLKVIRYGDEAWDGTFNSIELPSDDYWFTIEYVNIDGNVIHYKSHFSLIR